MAEGLETLPRLTPEILFPPTALSSNTSITNNIGSRSPIPGHTKDRDRLKEHEMHLIVFFGNDFLLVIKFNFKICYAIAHVSGQRLDYLSARISVMTTFQLSLFGNDILFVHIRRTPSKTLRQLFLSD